MFPSTESFLQACVELKTAGFRAELVPGMRVARGYADAGFEEFCLLSGGQMVSLQSGARVPIPEDTELHLVAVPDEDALVEYIERRGFDIVRLEYEEQRTWALRLRPVAADGERLYRSATLAEVFLAAARDVARSA